MSKDLVKEEIEQLFRQKEASQHAVEAYKLSIIENLPPIEKIIQIEHREIKTEIPKQSFWQKLASFF